MCALLGNDSYLFTILRRLLAFPFFGTNYRELTSSIPLKDAACKEGLTLSHPISQAGSIGA